MKPLYFFSLLFMLAGCEGLFDSVPKEGNGESKESPQLFKNCQETNNARSISLDCLMPANDSIYWAIVEVYAENVYDNEAIDDFADFIYENGKLIYERNIPCPDDPASGKCFKQFYAKPTAGKLDFFEGYFSYYRDNSTTERNARLKCSPISFNVFRFCIISDPQQTKILSGNEFLEFLGGINSYSEALLRWKFPMLDWFSSEDPLKKELYGIKELEEKESHYFIDFDYLSTNHFGMYEDQLDSCSTQYFNKKVKVMKATQEIEAISEDLLKEDDYRICNPCE